MAILKYANQSGVVYAYESISEWDPVKKQSRSKRKCLGRVDPDTGEIIPTSGRRGRPPKEAKKEGHPSHPEENPLAPALEKQKAECEELREQNKKLLTENKKLKSAISKIKKDLADL